LFGRLISKIHVQFFVGGNRKLKIRYKINQELKLELTKMGYSVKAIQEIAKWIALE